MQQRTINKISDLFSSNPEKSIQIFKRAVKRMEFGSHEDILQLFNKITRCYGTNAIYSNNYEGGYWGNVVAIYVNVGDTYANTLMLIPFGGSRWSFKLICANVGDWIEANTEKLDLK